MGFRWKFGFVRFTLAKVGWLFCRKGDVMFLCIRISTSSVIFSTNVYMRVDIRSLFLWCESCLLVYRRFFLRGYRNRVNLMWRICGFWVTISRCSKSFYTFSRCYFHIESTFLSASVSFVLSHIARHIPPQFARYRDWNPHRRERLHPDNALSMWNSFRTPTWYQELLCPNMLAVNWLAYNVLPRTHRMKHGGAWRVCVTIRVGIISCLDSLRGRMMGKEDGGLIGIFGGLLQFAICMNMGEYLPHLPHLTILPGWRKMSIYFALLSISWIAIFYSD